MKVVLDCKIIYRVPQKYLTILQQNCEWNRWRAEFIVERPSNETQSTSAAMDSLVCRASGFGCGDVFLRRRFCV